MNISILIATYGEDSWRELALARALPSVHSEPVEILVGHDPEGTIASCRNGLAEKATGDWLCFLDADDELAPGYLDAMRRAYERERGTDGVPLLLTPAVSYIHKGRARPPRFWPGTEETFKTGNWLVIGTLVPRDLFLRVGGFEDFPHGLEDWQLWAKCVKAGARIVKVRQAVYRAHWNSKSKHQKLARNRPDYMQHYEAARASVWG